MAILDVYKRQENPGQRGLPAAGIPHFQIYLYNRDGRLDTLLEKDIPDRASVVSDIGKGVKSIAGRIEEYRRSQGDAGAVSYTHLVFSAV